MSKKAILALVLALGIAAYFLVGRDAEPVEVTVENATSESTETATN